MQCSELMKTDLECISRQSTLREAAQRMRDQGIGFLPVCDESMHPIGTLTDRDVVVRAVAEDRSSTENVETCMTREIVDCRPSDDVAQARELMQQHRVSRIVCTNDDGRIAGVISLSDIVDQDQQGGASTLREVSRREVRGDSGAKSQQRPGARA